MDYASFVSNRRSMIVAPAGYGKTYTISECLKYTKGKQLILTHTHAGVASLKEKIKKHGIDNSCYKVETISSLAQKYVKAFYCGKDIPEQDDNEHFFPFIIQKARELLAFSPIRDVINATYTGLFVDEYQDCTISQHELIMVLSSILPTHILGDPLQGIFDFKEKLVDFSKDLRDFTVYPSLTIPRRWEKTNVRLGQAMQEIRSMLESKLQIDFKRFSQQIEIVKIEEGDLFKPKTSYNQKIWQLTNNESVLVIHPSSFNLNARKEIVKRFKNAFILVEAIDQADFYDISKRFDGIDPKNAFICIYNLIPIIFNGKTSQQVYFNEDGIKDNIKECDINLLVTIREDIDKINKQLSFKTVSRLLRNIAKLPKIKCYRKELFYDLCKALEFAEHNGSTVFEEMKQIRDALRYTGRRVVGRCIGTTLLTKGLEFDAVAIIDAHKFQCPKNFYVAVSRARKKLIIFTNNDVISPYSSLQS